MGLVANDVYDGDTLVDNYDLDVFGIGASGFDSLVSAGTAGLGALATGGTLDADEFLVAGHNITAGGVTTDDIDANVAERWTRFWRTDLTGDFAVNLTFDHSDGSVNLPSGSPQFVLLFSTDPTVDDFTPVNGATASVNGDTVSFASVDVQDGYYTLGTALTDAVVVGRHLFYNNSNFDEPGGGTDNDAIATDKLPLLPGGSVGFDNYSSYSRGINGVMIDVLMLSDPDAISTADFELRVGNSDNLGNWTSAPVPIVDADPHPTDAGVERITLIWTDGDIVGSWLEVKLLANANTGIVSDDIFYFGSAPGEAGTKPAVNAQVDGFDFASARDNLVDVVPGATIDNDVDFNRDKIVDGADIAIARDNATNFDTSLQLITVPGPPPTVGLVVLAPPIAPLVSNDKRERSVATRTAAMVDAAILELVRKPLTSEGLRAKPQSSRTSPATLFLELLENAETGTDG